MLFHVITNISFTLYWQYAKRLRKALDRGVLRQKRFSAFCVGISWKSFSFEQRSVGKTCSINSNFCDNKHSSLYYEWEPERVFSWIIHEEGPRRPRNDRAYFFLFSSLAIYLVINFRNLLESFIGKNTWQRVWSHILLSFWYWWPIDILHNENIFTSNCWADKNKEHFLKKSFPAFQINFTQIEKALFFYEQ